MQKHPRDSQRGIALLTALLAIVLVSAMAAAMFGSAQAEIRAAHTHRHSTQVLHLAEAGTVVAEQEILVAVANTLPPPATGSTMVGDHTINYTIQAVGAGTTETDADGIQTVHQHYRIDSTAELQGYTKTVHRVVDVGLTPIFQFAIFYNPDLELLPGPSMTLSGRVHSNQDIYVGVGNGSTLTIDSEYFRCVGNLYRKRKNDNSRTAGIVKVRKKGEVTFQDLFSYNDLYRWGIESSSGFDSDFKGYDSNSDGDLDDQGDWPDFAVGALTGWRGSIQTGAHGMRTIEPPSIGSIKRYESVGEGNGSYSWDADQGKYVDVGAGNGDHRKGRYHDSAGLNIIDGRAYDANGGAMLMPPGVVTTEKFYDAREGRQVTVTQIDIAKLSAHGLFPANGLIYAARTDATASVPTGIRLVNGAELSGALTVATENPLYVQGDYNTVDKKPASVIADAVNLLSNSWDDSKSAGNLPQASETSYNCAMITGADETIGSSYSGGFENLPRFHEKWGGVDCNIAGSFVKIYASEIADGAWKYGGDRYTAPNRNWDYDTMFNDVANLPPFTPNVAQIKSAGWWE